MSQTDRKKVRRRRSLRLNRQSLLVPLVSDSDATDCPSDGGIDNVGTSCVNSSTYMGQGMDNDGGSFWEEVDENKLSKKRRSRRSNIGFYVAKSNYDTEDNATDDEVASVAWEANKERNRLEADEAEATSPEIEVLRRPCPEASPFIQSPATYLTGSSNLDISQTKTPSVVNDKSLPYIQTPSSVSVSQSQLLGSGGGFDDALMLGMDIPSGSQEPDVKCPPSCEDDSEDSLLICTPDLSKFKKNIRFKCSLDFSEFNETPPKGDVSADNSQDSIHESPIVGYVYDKLNASEVARKRRSSSQRSGNRSSHEQPTKKRLGAPKRLVAVGNEFETKDADEASTKSPCDKDSKGPTTKSPKSLNVSIQSNSSTQSSTNTISSTSEPYTSCVEDDFLSLPSAQPSPVKSSEPTQSPSPGTSHTDQFTPVLPPSPVANVQNTDWLTPVLPHSLVCEVQNQDFSTPLTCTPETSKGKRQPDIAQETNSDEISQSNKNEPSEQCTAKVSESCTSFVADPIGMKKSTESTSVCKPKPRERNIASDVCEVFRSLARRFSGGGKRTNRRSGNLKKMKNMPRLAENTDGSPLLGGDSESSLGVVEGGSNIFSFRKEPKLTKQPTDESLPTSEDTNHESEQVSRSLDFSPFLPGAESNNNVVNVEAEPVSPVWKRQGDKLEQSYVNLPASADENTPFILETVIQEKNSDLDFGEIDDKPLKKRGRPKRRSIEASILQQEVLEFQACEQLPVEEEEENSSLRRSRRSRRSSLEMFRNQSVTSDVDSPETCRDSQDWGTDLQTKKPRSRKKAVPEENLEELYRNKNYTLPTERMWETLFESPEKTKQPSLLQSRRKYRRTITFDTLPPAKIRKRLQRAATQGWDVTGKKRRSIPLDEVKNKIALLASEINDNEVVFT